MKRLSLFLLLLSIVGSFRASAQDDKKQQEKARAEVVKSLMEAGTFTFRAETVSPLKGSIVHLSPGSYMRVTPEKLNCDLPYFGEMNQASIDQTNGGYKFESSDFEYKSEPHKKGGWEINIKPRDLQNGPQLNFTIQTNGTANLRINSNDRQSISYTGGIYPE